jgi:hypothetical protein
MLLNSALNNIGGFTLKRLCNKEKLPLKSKGKCLYLKFFLFNYLLTILHSSKISYMEEQYALKPQIKRHLPH